MEKKIENRILELLYELLVIKLKKAREENHDEQ